MSVERKELDYSAAMGLMHVEALSSVGMNQLADRLGAGDMERVAGVAEKIGRYDKQVGFNQSWALAVFFYFLCYFIFFIFFLIRKYLFL